MDYAALSKLLKEQIDEYCVKAYDDGHRSHLGASLIGHECSRYLWYVFRWVKREKFDARMLRLFQRGHLEEPRFVEYLRGIGWEVSIGPDVNFFPDAQHRVSAVMGHFGGSLDGLARPQDCPIPLPIERDPEAFLTEFKTNSTGQGFSGFFDKKVRRNKPRHWAQMNVYGVLWPLKHAVYMCVNKNDDDMYIEAVELDHDYGNELIGKAHSIIMSQEPPNRIAQTSAFHTCKFCDKNDLCFENARPEINCRSCKDAIPVNNAEWFCRKHNDNIPSDFIRKGCDGYESII